MVGGGLPVSGVVGLDRMVNPLLTSVLSVLYSTHFPLAFGSVPPFFIKMKALGRNTTFYIPVSHSY